MKNYNELWRLVNTVEKEEDIAYAEHAIRINDVDIDTFDALMMALAEKSRVSYFRQKKKKVKKHENSKILYI